ncbi:hypothetical protein DS745_04200 [Anaerobacillus alkaliphilus]|uniref:DUF1700 domain-containing protein n=2 Tax=Anaerobacillus alkaliphilus TaxID=1548597 RepID=A0A4Q0VZ04_9BACI|nr:hypothetical protein DS745_04200 [Anaerobacillus alkaliphilus]
MTKEEFVRRLRVELEGHPRGDEIVAEYADYMEQKHRDLLLVGNNEFEAEALVISQLEDPKTIARHYSSGLNSTKEFSKVLLINYLLFVIGLLLTSIYTLYQTTVVSQLWFYLVGQKWFILVGYCLLWACIGFSIGKKFGFKGRELHKRIFRFSLIPNYLLMLLVLYLEPIQHWFNPLLTPEFVIMCVIVTLLFYPISKISFKMGILKGI